MDFTQTIGIMDYTASTRPEIFRVKNLGWYSLTNKGLQGPYKNRLACQVAAYWSLRDKQATS